jgi:hypothetical protein
VLLFNTKLVLPARHTQFERFLSVFNSKRKPGVIFIPYKILPDFTRLCPSLDIKNSWLMGFTEAEGCFSISIRSTSNNYDIQFSVGQKGENNKVILNNFISLFGLGLVSERSVAEQEVAEQERFFIFSVTGLKNIRNIYPYFDNHSFLSIKGKSYLKFKELVELIELKMHLDPLIRPLLVALSKQINPKQNKVLQ